MRLVKHHFFRMIEAAPFFPGNRDDLPVLFRKIDGKDKTPCIVKDSRNKGVVSKGGIIVLRSADFLCQNRRFQTVLPDLFQGTARQLYSFELRKGIGR
ncbi:MAG: hypothetical protein A4E66_02378 [Syntrophus sp. PtaB.Bin001]|nr:MAG: hypothetical protein A4E66_02378 [Syntrophus sp. PtaB.Bin001]